MRINSETADDRNNATYAIYRQLHSARDAYPMKTIRTVISELMYAEPCAWRAVGITRSALDAYCRSGKNRLQGIERAHLTDRAKMIHHILNRDDPMTQQELFSYWRNTDQVVIALKSENRGNSFGEWIPFENDDARYFTRLGIGFHYRQAIEGELIKRLAEQVTAHQKPKIAPVCISSPAR